MTTQTDFFSPLRVSWSGVIGQMPRNLHTGGVDSALAVFVPVVVH